MEGINICNEIHTSKLCSKTNDNVWLDRVLNPGLLYHYNVFLPRTRKFLPLQTFCPLAYHQVNQKLKFWILMSCYETS